jgi:hypothetical protein
MIANTSIIRAIDLIQWLAASCVNANYELSAITSPWPTIIYFMIIAISASMEMDHCCLSQTAMMGYYMQFGLI